VWRLRGIGICGRGPSLIAVRMGSPTWGNWQIRPGPSTRGITSTTLTTNGDVRPSREAIWPGIHGSTRRSMLTWVIKLFPSIHRPSPRPAGTSETSLFMLLASAQRRPKSSSYTVRFLLSLFLALTLLLDTSELGTPPRSSSHAVGSALCLRSVVFCLPHVSSRPRLKRYDDQPTFTEPIISTHFYRDRPRCRKLYRAPQREQYLQGSPQVRPETSGACFAVHRNPQTSPTRQRTRLEAQKASHLHPREQFVPPTLYIVVQRINQFTLESGVIVEAESLLVDPHDTPYARSFVRAHSIF
jgi:hypothetical protein